MNPPGLDSIFSLGIIDVPSFFKGRNNYVPFVVEIMEKTNHTTCEDILSFILSHRKNLSENCDQ